MADDTISRQMAIDEIRRCRFVVDAIKKISELPSAERKGHWIKKWHKVFKEDLPCCSECNNFMAFTFDYCPNCGARMERETND